MAALGKRALGALAAALCVAAAAGGAAAPSPGGPADVLDVVRVGTGTAALTNAATAVSVVPLLGVGTGAGTLGAPIPLPTAASGANAPLTLSGSATSEGSLSLSADGRYLTLAGYDATPGTTGPGGGSIANSLTSTTPRVVGRLDGAGNVDTSTVLNAFTGNNPRGAVTDDGSRFWVTGAGSSGNPRGVVFALLGNAFSTALTAVGSNVTNARVPVIAGGQLYLSTNNNTPPGLYRVGTGLPTTPQAATALVAATGSDPYSFAFTDPTTLYVADGGIRKYSFDGATWNAEGSASAGTQLGGLAGRVEGGVVQLYATALDGTRIFAFADSAASNAPISGSFATLATAAANTVFRGIAFAPSGQVPPAPASTIALSDTSLGGVIGDPGNPTLTATVHNDTVPDDQIALTASSSNQAVAPDGGIAVAGTGAARTVWVTPGGTVGYATITLTETAPGAPATTVQFLYGASAPAPDGTSHFLDGASDASTAVDVGGGYVVVGDDESNVLRLYGTSRSGGPVKTWDFTTQIGASSIDIEAAARLGDTIYWTGSMGNNSDGSVKPARSTLFATTVTGSGASTELTLVGVYRDLRSDLLAWDHANGDPLGFAAGAADGQIPKEIDGFNVEGLELAADGTAYLGFRAPLLPQTDRHLALVVPVTNLTSLVSGGGPARFGAPMFWNLGGLGVRELRRSADGQYLVIAGSYAEGGDEFLYSWDGDPEHQPAKLTTTLPPFLTGAWEGVVAAPDPLADGARVQLVMDDGDWSYYGDEPPVEAKDQPLALRKALIDTFTLGLPAPPAVGAVTDVTAEATGPPGAVVTYPTPSATDPIDPSPTVTCLPASGSTFPLGPTTVTCRASDVQGRTSAPATFTVTVTDTTPPVLAGVPADVRLDTTDPAGRAVTFPTPTATDLVDGADAVTCAPPSGSTFPVGTTTVTCSARDAHGNRASATFTVEIDSTPLSTVRGVLAEFAAAPAGPHLRDAVRALADAQLPAGWLDGDTLAAKGGDHVFDDLHDACTALEAELRGPRATMPDATVERWLDALAGAAGDVAASAIDEAPAGADAKKLAHAGDDLASGRDALAAGRDADAVVDFANAWHQAQDAAKRL
jgi:hypothetical protein